MLRRVCTNPAPTASALSILLLVAGYALVSMPRAADAYTPHGYIEILSDAGFTAANGVVGGSGTPGDPFVIEGWEFIGSVDGILIRDTSAAYVIRDVYFNVLVRGIILNNASNGRVERAVVAGAESGILVGVGASNVTLLDNDVTNTTYAGLLFSGASNVTVEGNRFTNNTGMGMNLGFSSDLVIRGNTLLGNGGGIYIHDSFRAEIYENVQAPGGITFNGDEVEHFRSHEVSANNTVNGLPVSYTRDCSGLDLDGALVGIAIVANCTGVRIANLTISDTDAAIQLAFVHEASVSDLNLTRNLDAVQVHSSQDVDLTRLTVVRPRNGVAVSADFAQRLSLSDSVLTGTEYGEIVTVTSSHDISVFRTVMSNGGQALFFLDSENVTVWSNRVSDSYLGIEVQRVRNATVSSNTIERIGYGTTGVQYALAISASDAVRAAGNEVLDSVRGVVSYHSTNVTVSDNLIRGNGVGAYVEHYDPTNFSYEVHVHHNRFLGNAVQAEDGGGTPAAWDDGYPSGGNYWSDYAGPDLFGGPAQDVPGPDGMGDVPREIDADSRDRYPLVYLPPETRLVVGVPNVTAGARSVTSTTPLTLAATDHSGTGINRTEYRLDGGAWTPYAGSIALGGEGEHLLDWFSEDNLWRLESAQSAVLRVDDTPPAPAVTVGEPRYVGPQTFVTSSTPLALTAPDGGPAPVGTAGIEYRLGAGPWTPYAVPIALSGPDGPVGVGIRASDLLGNAAATSEELVLDDTPPNSTLAPGPGDHPAGTQFGLDATDAGSGVALREYRVDAGAWTPFTAPFAVPEGSHVIEYRSADRLGNAEAPQRAEVTIGSGEPPPETPPNLKPILALAFCLIILAAAFVRRRRNEDRRALLLHAPFLALEASIGGVSWATGVLSVPPWLGAGTIVNTAIVASAFLVPWLLNRGKARGP